jgi:putative sigma-54 modulation protein
MRYIINGKNIQVTNALETKIMEKLSKVEKFFVPDTEVHITLSVEKLRHIIEITIPIKGTILRAEVEDRDMYACIDQVVDILEKQILKFKNKLRDRHRHDSTFKEEFVSGILFKTEDEQKEPSLRIERTKRFAIKPMDAEEAALEMDLIGHNFFVFRNGDTDEVNVVYKRHNGTYGLIEPEF